MPVLTTPSMTTARQSILAATPTDRNEGAPCVMSVRTSAVTKAALTWSVEFLRPSMCGAPLLAMTISA